MTRAQIWSDDVRWKPVAHFRGSTWNPPFLWHDAPMAQYIASLKPSRVSPTGQYAYANVILQGGERINWQRLPTEKGWVDFDSDVVIPVLYDEGERAFSLFTGKSALQRRPWMSITPMEIVSLRPLIHAACGDVVIGGLGLGWVLRRVAAKPTVRSVTVIEYSRELAEWAGPQIIADVKRETGKTVKIVVADVFGWMDAQSTDDRMYLLDIWKDMDGASRDIRVHRQLRRGLDVHAWGLDPTLARALAGRDVPREEPATAPRQRDARTGWRPAF